jgi:hypothetical protein
VAILVICSYKPKAGQTQALKGLLADHVPTLQRLGLATARAPFHGTGQDGTVVEIFEWVSEDASRSAHDHAEVKRLWGRFADICDFVPLASLTETQRPFADFSN